MDEQLLQEAAALEQYTNQLEQNREYLARQISELEEFSQYLSELIKSTEKSMLASIGKGVYLKSDIIERELFVEVGAGVIVKKTPAQLQSVISGQLVRLRETHSDLATQIGFYAQKLNEIMQLFNESNTHKH